LFEDAPARKLQRPGPASDPVSLWRPGAPGPPRKAMTRLRQLTRAAVAGLLATASITCGGDNTQPPTPSAIAMVSGDGQIGAVGSALANPLVVLVTDDAGNPSRG
jgi:hypothetical protein